MRPMSVLGVIAASVALASATVNTLSSSYPVHVASVLKINGQWQIMDTLSANAIANATFADAVNETGWAFLNVTTNPLYDNYDQAYAAGFVEGYISQHRIYQSFVNGGGSMDLPLVITNFLDTQHAWILNQIGQNPKSDYWQQANLVFGQVMGVYDGYSFAAPAAETLGYNDIWWMNIGSDISDLQTAFNVSAPDADAVDSHCSGLVKLTADKSELFTAQVTWTEFVDMLRVYKRYDLQFTSLQTGGLIPGHATVFSSYPGVIFSGDDFYQISSGLVVLETTIGNGNQQLWNDFIKPQCVLEFTRNIVANRLATSGGQWSKMFAEYNSGTYNNEWLIVDYKLFTPGEDPPANTVWLLDQVPGYVQSGDVTAVMLGQGGYMPSYNIAYFPFIFNVSGGPEAVEEYGPWFAYATTPRAEIYARDHHKVVDLQSMQAMMRYNDFKNDPLARCECTPPYSGENGISARSDLNPANGVYPFAALGLRPHGGIDAKVTSSQLFAAGMATSAISGPTYDYLPPFQFSASPFANLTHEGLPDLWQFPWMTIQF